MEVTALFVVISVGLVVGLVSGLVGLGGGTLVVPFLYFFYDRPDLFGFVVDHDAQVLLAHGTSLFFIIPTSFRGVVAYKESGLIEWHAVWPIGIASLFSAIAGTRLAVILPPELLKTGFGALLMVSGLRLVTPRRGSRRIDLDASPPLSLIRVIPVGIIIGFFAALLGIGGGMVGVPLMIYALKLDVRKVAPTSLAIVGLTSIAGSLGYIISGLGQPGLPPLSLGYVHVSAALLLFIGAFASVQWGATLNQRLKPRSLEILFGTLFIVLGLGLVAGNLIALVQSAI